MDSSRNYLLPLLMAIHLLLVSLPEPAQAQADSQRGDWTWGMREIDDYDNRGRQKKAPQASTNESQGRGAPLVLLRCQERYLTLVDGPEDNFWSGQSRSDLDPEGVFKIGWIIWDDKRIPIMMESGQDGYYFDIDVSDGTASVGGKFKDLLKVKSFGICPSRESLSSKCRRFSGNNFDKAVSYVCKRK